MQLRRLVSEDDAVSPVIGVILMVAITVILAAVIGAFVLGFDAGTQNAPQVSWDVTEDISGSGNENVTFTHRGGDSVQTGDLEVVDGAGNRAEPSSGTRLTAGSELDVGFTAGSANSAGDRLRVVWSEDGSDETTVIGTHRLTESVDGLDSVTT